jgi:RNA polymerase sigma factor (sigma-70 family)
MTLIEDHAALVAASAPDPPPRASPRDHPDDAAVIVRSLREPQAFAAVFDRHWPPIHAFCTARAGAAGEDLAAEVFSVAFARRRRYDPAFADARPWLYGIATNLLSEHFRGSARGSRALARAAALGGDGRAPGAQEPLPRFEAHMLGPELAAALGSLPAADRDALLLRAWAELDYDEIARALDIPIGTVRSRIHRARRRVRNHLSQKDLNR